MTYILIHSPLVGPSTWQLVRAELEQLGRNVIVPELEDQPTATEPYWQQHASSLSRQLISLPAQQRVILVAHSGAGPLLPVIGQSLPGLEVSAYIFVDAGIPRDQASRLDLMRLQDPEWARAFQQSLQRGEQFPTWREEDLQEVIPDIAQRQQMIAEVHPRSLSFFTEPIPVFSGWPDAPCAYIKFSSAYTWDFQQAKQASWWVHEVNAGHFHMLVEPTAVTQLIIEAVETLVNHSPLH